MAPRNLEEMLKVAGNPVDMLRNSKIGAYIYPVVPPEFTNWRDEQKAWRDTVVLCDQSHHMAEMYVEGPDAFKMLSELSVNSFAGFTPNKAKQMVALSHDGYVIGDGILFYLDENKFNFVGREPIVNWIQFHAETGGYDVAVARDDRSPGRPGGKPVVRRNYRFQLQGPNAWALLETLNGAAIPAIKFFNMGVINIAGRQVRGLRHGMAGAPAWSSGVRTTRARRSAPPSSRRARRSASTSWVRGPIPRSPWSRAGSRRRCRPSTPARR